MQAAAGAGHNGTPSNPITIQGLASPAATGMRPPRRHRRRPTSQDSLRHLTSKSSTDRPIIQPRPKRPPPTPTTPTRCCYGVGCWFLRRNLCVYIHEEADHRHLQEKTQKMKDLIELNTKEKLARLAARSARPALADLNRNPAPPQADNMCYDKKEAAPKAETPEQEDQESPADRAQRLKFAADARMHLHRTSMFVSMDSSAFPPEPSTTAPAPATTQWRAKGPVGYRTTALFNRRHPQKRGVQTGDIVTAAEIVFGDSGEPHPNNGYHIPFIRNAHGYLPLRQHHCRGHPDHNVHLFEQISGTEFKIG